jgi:hypothetical protein
MRSVKAIGSHQNPYTTLTVINKAVASFFAVKDVTADPNIIEEEDREDTATERTTENDQVGATQNSSRQRQDYGTVNNSNNNPTIEKLLSTQQKKSDLEEHRSLVSNRLKSLSTDPQADHFMAILESHAMKEKSTVTDQSLFYNQWFWSQLSQYWISVQNDPHFADNSAYERVGKYMTQQSQQPSPLSMLTQQQLKETSSAVFYKLSEETERPINVDEEDENKSL